MASCLPFLLLIIIATLILAPLPMPKDCRDVKDLGGGKNGIYTIFPTETGCCTGYKVWCDQSQDGGGWLVNYMSIKLQSRTGFQCICTYNRTYDIAPCYSTKWIFQLLTRFLFVIFAILEGNETENCWNISWKSWSLAREGSLVSSRYLSMVHGKCFPYVALKVAAKAIIWDHKET